MTKSPYSDILYIFNFNCLGEATFILKLTLFLDCLSVWLVVLNNSLPLMTCYNKSQFNYTDINVF